ncbi:O-antigen ligase family protein [Roseibium sp.]|uniref:O-antigen ligase family protein n=1 Tax=Roseibium sp. TaxID=1936156 RepID=UPI003BAA03A7
MAMNQDRTLDDIGSNQSIGLFAQLLIISLFIPVKLNVGSLLLTPYRIVILIAIAPVMMNWLSGAAGKKTKSDYFMLIYVIWSMIATLHNHGFVLIEKMAIYFIEIGGTYFIARTQIRSVKAARDAFMLLWLGVLFLLPFALFESVTNRSLFQTFLGPIGPARVLADTRLGFFRAQAAFDHPILLGMFAGSILAPSYYLLAHGKSFFQKILRTSIPLVCAFTSLSSGAFAGVAIQIGLMGWDMVVKAKNRWKILAALAATAYVAVDLLSTRTPYAVLISYLSFSSGSAYNRILIWRFSQDDLFRNPIFGIGFNEWDRPAWMHSASTDNFWLVIALNYGIVGFLFFFLAFIFAIRYLIQQDFVDPMAIAFRRGYIIMLVGLGTAIITVHMWGAAIIVFVFYLGMHAIPAEEGNAAMQSNVQVKPEKRRLPYTRGPRSAHRLQRQSGDQSLS